MRALTSLAQILTAIVLAGVLMALALAPVAGLSGIAVARTQEAMETGLADLTDGTTPGVTTVYDGENKPIAWLYKQRRFEVPADQIAQPMKDAIVSIEDRRFYEHDGVDWTGTLRAMVTNLLSGSVRQGASTLDQQYVKNYMYLVNADTEEEAAAAVETSYARKLREMKMASELDKNLPKEEILARYLNLVPYGNGAFGIEAAARTYFNTSAAQLTVPQAAMLAGLVQSTSGLDPYTNPEGALERRNTVLETMAETGAIPQADVARYQAEPLGVLPEPQGLPQGCITAGDLGFFCDYVLSYLDGKGISTDDLLKSSYEIHTTIDPAMQARTKQSVDQYANPTTPGVAETMNVINPGDKREVVAMANSRSYGLDAENFETVLPLTASTLGSGAGSVFKIFTAATALKEGIGIDTVLQVPARVEKSGMGFGGAKNCPAGMYCVENAGTYKPQMTLREALAFSPNTTFVNLIEAVGVEDTVNTAVDLGLRSYKEGIARDVIDHNSGSFTLGPTPVNPLELTNVAATLASGGRWCEPTPIRSITEAGKPVHLDVPACEDVLEPGLAGALSLALSDDLTKGTASTTGKAMNWQAPASSKTGTTESHQSSAFLGYNTGFAASTYIFNDGQVNTPLCTAPLRQCQDGTLYGGMEATATWVNVANQTASATSGALPQADSRYNSGTATLPNVAGLSKDAATKRLKDAGYKVSTTTYAPGNGTPRERALYARFDGLAHTGASVTLVLSDGTKAAPTPTSTAPTPQVPGAPQTPQAPTGPSDKDLEELANAVDNLLREFG